MELSGSGAAGTVNDVITIDKNHKYPRQPPFFLQETCFLTMDPCQAML
jgi:hypothetical protein